jgi:hypothetical protein
MIFMRIHPMVLYHVTVKDRVAKIRREGLRPHVPGKVWGVCDPSITRGKRVVWLTADRHTWHHAKHPNKSRRNPEGVLLTIMIPWNAPKLKHYMSWRDPRKKEPWTEHVNNPAAWFVHFGRVPPGMIIGGLERPKRKRR